MMGFQRKTHRMSVEEYLSVTDEVIYWLNQPEVWDDNVAQALANQNRDIL